MLYSRRVDARVTVWRKLTTYWNGVSSGKESEVENKYHTGAHTFP